MNVFEFWLKIWGGDLTSGGYHRSLSFFFPATFPSPVVATPMFHQFPSPHFFPLTLKFRVPELIPVLGSQPAGDVSHKPGGRLPLLSARPAVTPATLKRAATNFAAW